MRLSRQRTQQFQAMLRRYYEEHGRHDLPWRRPDGEGFDPYKIVVSELMLQQTQVRRVIPKYEQFLARFPSVDSLARVDLGEVLVEWQGLGYNRRAKFLWQTAQRVVEQGGIFPTTLEGLISLPGIGRNTAGAVLAYAYDRPALFIETNVRTVYIHHFFSDGAQVHDAQIQELLAQTLPSDNLREFYWSLMDYGTFLKKSAGNASIRSSHYVRQSPFEGSRRQVRGAILRTLSARGYRAVELAKVIPDERRPAVLEDLQKEGMVARTDGVYHLA